MYKHIFKAQYKNNNYETLIAVKFCRYPKKTKVYKTLVNLLDRDIIKTYSIATEPLQ